MAAGIVAASARRPADKAAVWPGDAFYTADALMPGWVTTSSDKALRLTYCGFYPDPQYLDPWMNRGFTYHGATIYWSGSCWREGPPVGGKATVAAGTGVPATYTDLSRMSIARRVTALNILFTASPTTPWAADQYAQVTTQVGSGVSKMGHIIQWNGTSWVLISTSPEYLGNAWDKTLTPGALAVMDTNITAGDATNANKLAGLGYTLSPALAAPGFTWLNPMVTFPSPTTTAVYTFNWNGTAWTTATVSDYTYSFSSVTHAGIAALQASERAWAAKGVCYPASVTVDTPGTYVTVAGQQMHFYISTWRPGPAPGTVPPTPTKTAIASGDVYSTPQSEMPTPASGATSYNVIMTAALTAAGYRPAQKEPWKTASLRYFTYCNIAAAWTGSQWCSSTGLSTSKVAIAHTDNNVVVDQTTGLLNLSNVADADRVAAMSAWYTNPASAWTADQHLYVGGCVMQWNGSTWVQLAKYPTIHEAATVVCQPGNVYIDSRVTVSNSTIAAQLLGWGYVPVIRNRWVNNNLSTNVMSIMYIRFINPTAASNTYWSFYWDGTTWVSGVTPGGTGVTACTSPNTYTNALIAALPAEEKCMAAQMAGYYSASAMNTTGQGVTIGGQLMHYHGNGSVRFYWAPGAVP